MGSQGTFALIVVAALFGAFKWMESNFGFQTSFLMISNIASFIGGGLLVLGVLNVVKGDSSTLREREKQITLAHKASYEREKSLGKQEHVVTKAVATTANKLATQQVKAMMAQQKAPKKMVEQSSRLATLSGSNFSVEEKDL